MLGGQRLPQSRSARVRDIGWCLNIRRLRPLVIGLAVIGEVIAKNSPDVYRIVGEEHGVLGSRRVDGPAAEAGGE
jgi:hypothetical protein